MFYTEDPNKLREIMKKNNIQELSFNFDLKEQKQYNIKNASNCNFMEVWVKGCTH